MANTKKNEAGRSSRQVNFGMRVHDYLDHLVEHGLNFSRRVEKAIMESEDFKNFERRKNE